MLKIPQRFANLNLNETNAKTLEDIKRKIRSVQRSNMPFRTSTVRDYYEYYKYRGGKLSLLKILKGY